MRALGIDWGERRVGVALSDSGGTLATPYATIEHANDETRVISELQRLLEETQAQVVVLGLPKALSGGDNESATTMTERANRLREALGVDVELVDERLTSVSAHQSLGSVGMREKSRRKRVDEVAATILLQAWLDSRRS